MIAVIHAYSRANAGDGLLLDLTMRRLERAGVRPEEDVVVVAMDPSSFEDVPHVVKLGTAGRRADREAASAAVAGLGVVSGSVWRRARFGRAARALADVDAFVAVGGGYIRTGTFANSMGTAINHVPPLVAAARSGLPSLYLPQSIGPLAGPVGRVVRAHLAAVGEVHVRDDPSMAALDGLGNVRRTPDLPVLAIADAARHGVVARELGGPPLLIARELTGARDYTQRLRSLAGRFDHVTWGVQAEGSVDKSDRTFYDTLGVRPSGRVATLLTGTCGPVVSVRLHGALQAILAGVPAVHLAYQRKGWGAYADLGLQRWVHNARSFDPQLVADQVRQLAADPTPFWSAIAARTGRLQEQSQALDDSLRRVLAA